MQGNSVCFFCTQSNKGKKSYSLQNFKNKKFSLNLNAAKIIAKYYLSNNRSTSYKR